MIYISIVYMIFLFFIYSCHHECRIPNAGNYKRVITVQGESFNRSKRVRACRSWAVGARNFDFLLYVLNNSCFFWNDCSERPFFFLLFSVPFRSSLWDMA